jgi:hypothetical protein
MKRKLLLFGMFIFLQFQLHAQDLIICGVVLVNESSDIILCSHSSSDIDVSGYLIAVHNRPIEIYSHRVEDKTIIAAGGTLKIEVPFLDFPFRRNGNGREKYNKYYLFNHNGEMLHKFNMRGGKR